MNLNLNTETVELNDFQPIERGWYHIQVIEESEKETQKGGKQLVYKYRIYGDKFNGRTLFQNFNVMCPGSPKAEQIAREEIARLGKACKLANVVNSADLINGCCQVLVDIEEYEGKVRNVVKAYDYAKDSAPATTSDSAPKNWWEKKK